MLIAYNGARKQSRQFAPAVAGALREGKLDEAIKIADRFIEEPPGQGRRGRSCRNSARIS